MYPPRIHPLAYLSPIVYAFSHLLCIYTIVSTLVYLPCVPYLPRQVLQVPFAISFEQNTPNSTIASGLDFFVIAVFFTDILCTFNTSFVDFHSDHLVTDRFVIGASYMKAWFWLDLVSSIPFDQIPVTSGNGGSGAVRVVRVLRLLRLTRLFKLARLLQFQRLKELSQDMRVSVAVTNVIVLLLQVHYQYIHYPSKSQNLKFFS